jgi:hypothetical protein
MNHALQQFRRELTKTAPIPHPQKMMKKWGEGWVGDGDEDGKKIYRSEITRYSAISSPTSQHDMEMYLTEAQRHGERNSEITRCKID